MVSCSFSGGWWEIKELPVSANEKEFNSQMYLEVCSINNKVKRQMIHPSFLINVEVILTLRKSLLQWRLLQVNI